MEFIKWMRILTYIAIVSLVNSVVNYLPFVNASVTTWVSRGIMAATVICMLNLSPINGRYKSAGIFRAVTLACAFITAYLFGSMILTLGASVFSVLAIYQEYNAHAELVAEKDMRLSRKWHSLFYWELAATILLSFGSAVAAVILISSELQVSASRISGIVIFFLSIPRFVIYVVRLLYLQKTINYFLVA